MYATIQVGNLVKKKRSRNSFEKLSKFLSIKDIFIGLFIKLFQMVLFRLVEVQIKEWSVELDDSKILSENDIIRPKDVEKCNKTGEIIQKNRAKWTEEEEMTEKYEELWSKHGMGIDAIEHRYFEDSSRKKIICFDLEEIRIDFNFNQSEKFLILVQSDRGYMYLYAKNNSTIFTPSEMYNPYNKRKEEKLSAKSPYLILMAKGASFKVKYPMKMNKTLQYINSSIKFYLHESQFFMNKKSIELFLSFFWNIKLMNNIKSFAKKSKIDQVKGETGYAYLLKK